MCTLKRALVRKEVKENIRNVYCIICGWVVTRDIERSTGRMVVCFEGGRWRRLSITPRPEGTASKAIVISPKATSYIRSYI